ncbi:hypothetical protein ZIOFF_031874 [Zingiber officinale]|uniref:DUF659 domain-containing protein n=1 Tax=Zingiber officinale TaxID=94328 RepID=A0A8J5GMY6_ZINOF|nr:hypothetical protein ZIOFF_031874 [Zingiber officinale]
MAAKVLPGRNGELSYSNLKWRGGNEFAGRNCGWPETEGLGSQSADSPSLCPSDGRRPPLCRPHASALVADHQVLPSSSLDLLLDSFDSNTEGLFYQDFVLCRQLTVGLKIAGFRHFRCGPGLLPSQTAERKLELRKTKGWKEIIRLGETRFATTFIALKSLHDHKDSLQALVTSGDYKKFLKIDKGKEVKQIVLNEKFWNNCLITMRIMGPLIRLLRVCDTDERPSLGYVYEGMYRAINGIKKLFKNKERFYKPYTNIINERWDRMLRKNLHAAAYYLNHAFQYDPTFSTHPEITNGLFDYIESKVDWCSLDVLTYEIDFWVVEEIPIGELDYDELEEELEELLIPLESSNFQQFEDDEDEAEPEDVNLDLFQRRSVLVDEDDWI